MYIEHLIVLGDSTDLPQLKTVVNLVLEWTHLDLSDEFRLDMSVTKDSRE